MSQTQFQSLYFHFPFCETKCHYCDFYSLGRDRTKTEDVEKFESVLRIESELWTPSLSQSIDTVFFGGGTPSMTSATAMRRALEPLDLGSRLSAHYEWSIEANPSSLTRESIKEYASLGINRVSLGVQSLDDETLKRFGRVHTATQAQEVLEGIFESGIQNVSVDLLCGIPGQTLAELEKTIDRLCSFPITHLSCYLLTLHSTHRMAKDLPNESAQLDHLLFIDRKMASLGFEHYEISNFAKPGFEARHNLAYWKGLSYLGFGPSASSFDRGASKRWKNIPSISKYSEKLARREKPTEFEETLSREQLEIEKWMLTLRLSEGFPKDWIQTPLQESRLQRLIDENYVIAHPSLEGRYRLTPKGFAVSDTLVTHLMPSSNAPVS